MKNTVFVFSALSRCQPGSDKLRQSAPLYLSSREQTDHTAARYLSDYAFLYDNENDKNCLYCLLAEEYLLNAVYPEKISTLVYSPDGKLMNVSEHSICRSKKVSPPHKGVHQVGEIVESACGDRLSLGIVVEPPETPSASFLDEAEDCYTVLSYPSLEMDYQPSAFVFEPQQKVAEGVEAVLREALQEYLAFQQTT